MNCKENFFGLVAELLACPPENISLSEDVLSAKKTITIDATQNLVADENLLVSVPMKSKSVECTETQKEELPGISYEVNVSWTIDNPSKEDYEKLEKLKWNHNHLIIRMLGDIPNGEYSRYFVYSSEDGYRFEYNENKGVLECKFSIVNTNGLQRLYNIFIVNGEE